MKKWNLEGTIHFRAHDFECEAEDKDGALEKLLEAGLFDYADCMYTVEEFEKSLEMSIFNPVICAYRVEEFEAKEE